MKVDSLIFIDKMINRKAIEYLKYFIIAYHRENIFMNFALLMM